MSREQFSKRYGAAVGTGLRVAQKMVQKAEKILLARQIDRQIALHHRRREPVREIRSETLEARATVRILLVKLQVRVRRQRHIFLAQKCSDHLVLDPRKRRKLTLEDLVEGMSLFAFYLLRIEQNRHKLPCIRTACEGGTPLQWCGPDSDRTLWEMFRLRSRIYRLTPLGKAHIQRRSGVKGEIDSSRVGSCSIGRVPQTMTNSTRQKC